MKHYYQPEHSSTCGQHCVAMIADITPEESIKLFKSKGGTRTKQVVSVLRSLGFECEDKLTKGSDEIFKNRTEIMIIKVRWTDERKFTHWMVVDGENREVLCPGYGVFPLNSKNFDLINGVATSYLKVKKKA